MNSESISQKLDSLESKIKKLIEYNHYTKEELRNIKNENEVLRKQLDIKNDEIKNFQNQHKISKIANAVVEDKKLTTDYKNKINEYIKEIEKGLAYLNKV